MAKECGTFEHTADVGLDARADTFAELLEALGEGLADMVAPRRQVRTSETRELSIISDDTEPLVVDFLNELSAVLEADRFLVARVRVRSASETAAHAELLGEPFESQRHEYATEVKAATYHDIRIARDQDGWHGRVILDV
ncbi:MAG: archease [Planctomycetota bacterium]